jgi:hypothetical protein
MCIGRDLCKKLEGIIFREKGQREREREREREMERDMLGVYGVHLRVKITASL